MLSRHFQRLAEHRAGAAGDTERDCKKLQAFVTYESQRQKRLATKQSRSEKELELLTDLLQFCDLLSLYICAGARENVEFPECFGVKARLRVETEGYRFESPWMKPGSEFSVAALRHPATKEVSGREGQVKSL